MRWGAEAVEALVARHLEQDALEAMGMAAAAAVRRLGPTPLWALVAGVTGGRLLANTSSPIPADS